MLDPRILFLMVLLILVGVVLLLFGVDFSTN